jgi:hypothetical protein
MVRAFADDISMILEDWRVLDEKLEVINAWSSEHGIKINPEKSAIIRILKRTGKIKGIPNIMNIKEVKEYKYLGVWMSQSLNFDKQIKQVKKRSGFLWKKIGR